MTAPAPARATAAPRPIAEVHQARIDAAARAHAAALAAYKICARRDPGLRGCSGPPRPVAPLDDERVKLRRSFADS